MRCRKRRERLEAGDRPHKSPLKTTMWPSGTAESAIGLAILVVLFRNRATIAADELDALKG